jgi:hypothetical protein
MSDERQNEIWEDIKYVIYSDLQGNWVTTTSHTQSNHFRIDPHYHYHYLSEEEANEQRRIDERRNAESHKRIQRIISVIRKKAEKHLTGKQKYVLNGFLHGMSWTEMAEERGCSEAAIRQVFYGNSKGQGGIVRKLQKILAEQNYFEFH